MRLRAFFLTVLSLFGLLLSASQVFAGDAPVPAAAFIEPADVAKLLPLDPKSDKQPLILHTGFKVLFDIAHIPGSKYLGPANKPEGLKLLRDYLEKTPRDREIIVYCGCCPMTKCPNYQVSYNEVVSMGFKNVRAIKMPENFATDWTKHGYPVEK